MIKNARQRKVAGSVSDVTSWGAFIEDSDVPLAIFDKSLKYLASSAGWARTYKTDIKALIGKCHSEIFPDDQAAWQTAIIHQRAAQADADPSKRGGQGWKTWKVKGDPGGMGVALEWGSGPQPTDTPRYAESLDEILITLGIGLLEHDFRSGTTILSDTYLSLLGIERKAIPTDEAGWIDLMKPRDVGAYHAARAAALDPKGNGRFTCDVFPVVDGKERTMQIQSRVIFTGSGAERHADHVIGLLVDRTEEQLLQNSLAHAERLETLGRMAGTVAHDFNNVLSVIIGNLELAEPRIHDRQTLVMVRNAMEASQMGAGFNKRLLALAGGNGGKPVRFALDEHLSRTWEIYGRILRDDISLHFEPGSRGAVVFADPSEIDAAVLNLIVNAKDAQPEGGEIRITTALDMSRPVPASGQTGDDPVVTITVSDKGHGMSKETLARASEPFFTTKPEGTGSGLGLASVDAVARRAGGRCLLRSELGKGTSVSILLPATVARLRRSARKTEQVQIGNGERVLVVEDDPLVREVALSRLEALGYRVDEASTAEQALGRLDTGESFDLVFSDIVLPGAISGLGLASKLRDEKPSVGVLLTSGHVSATYRTEIPDGKSPEILSKPYSLNELAAAVARTIRMKRQSG